MDEAKILHKHSFCGRVEFCECDPMGIVWHGNYLRYMDAARGDMLDVMGFGYLRMGREGFALPVVTTNLKFIRPLRLYDRFSVDVYLLEYVNRLKCAFEIKKGDEVCLKAESVQVHVKNGSESLEFFMPQSFVETVDKYLADRACIYPEDCQK